MDNIDDILAAIAVILLIIAMALMPIPDIL